MKHVLAGLWMFAFTLAFSTIPALGQEKTIWQIGKYNQSNFEFKAGPAAHIIYQVGRSDWAQDWPGEEQVGANYEIRFQLETAPRGVFSLKVALLTGYVRTPNLQVSVNGHQGIYYVRSQPIYQGTSAVGGVLTIDLPTQFLVKGINSLVFTPVSARPSNAEAAASYGSLRYDFIALSNDARARYDRSAVRADVIPTVFYRRGEGGLVETVEAYLRFDRAIPAGRAVLSMNGKSFNAAIAARDSFGEERLEFEIPEWQGTSAANLRVTAGIHRSFNLSLTAERKWTLFVVPHTHVDIGYTDYQGKVAEEQAHTLAEAARLITAHPDFRFTTDGSWNLQQLMETRSQPERKEILSMIRTDKIGLPADYFNLLTGYASLETLYRSLYYTKGLSRKYGLPFDYATTTDVPSYTGAYPSVLASAGIRYWAAGANQDRAPVLAHEQWNEKSPFWWEGPDGKKVLFWYSRHYMQVQTLFGLPPELDAIPESLPI
ncbi:MAG: polysaccharide lyase family protein, partial [Terriglobia bacterium]